MSMLSYVHGRRPLQRTTGRLLAALALTLVASPAHAQLSELTVGTRVRMQAPSAVAGRLTGVVLVRSADSVTVSRNNAAPLAVPIAALTSLEISRGKSHGRGAWTGALWGGGSMFALGLVIPPEETCSSATGRCETDTRAESALFAGLGGAMIGALIGGIVGSERWDRATLPARVSVQPASRHGPGVSVRWAF
jgi:hypothetical protein